VKVLMILFFVFAFAGSSLAGDRYTKGHYRDTDGDGYKETYVNPYRSSQPDGNKYNNYSSQGNTNPYNGKQGTEDPNPYTSGKQYKSFYSK